MDLERKRGGGVAAKNGVIAGSVWETRMQSDDIKGGIKGFNTGSNARENRTSNHTNNNANSYEIQAYKRVRPKSTVAADRVTAGKRKTWKSDSSDGTAKSPFQISYQRPEKEKDELKVPAEGIKKSPVLQIKNTRYDAVKVLSQSVDEFDRSPIHRMRTRAMWQRLSGDFGDQNLISLRKLICVPSKNSVDEYEGSHGLRKEKSKKNQKKKDNIGINKSKSCESLEELDGCKEKVITTDLDNMGQIESPKFEDTDDDGYDDDDDEDEDEDEEDDWDDDEMEDEIKKNSIVVTQMNILSKQLNPMPTITGKQNPPNHDVVVSEKKIVQRNERTSNMASIVRKQVPLTVTNHKFIPKPISTSPSEPQKAPSTHSKLQSLVMWRDISRSALIFGVGTFSITPSSYTNDLNISFISVISYMGLVYLAAIFLLRYVINRESIDYNDVATEEHMHVVGEEEAIRVLKLILPYINEFLVNVRALFSGDPATTMKLAVLLFVLARCGSSITIWKMAKLGFFGVFTVPKVCSSYSSQLSAFETFWIRRFRDIWDLCTQKKALGFAIFMVVWNLSSVVDRMWTVFMLFVAFIYYQHSMIRDERIEEDASSSLVTKGGQDSQQGHNRGPRQGIRSSTQWRI